MVVLSHPTGNANSRQAMLALFERQMLEGFYTTVAWDGSSAWNRVLPERLLRELKRRTYPQIPMGLIHTRPAREICRVLAGKVGLPLLAEHQRSPFSIAHIYEGVDRMAAGAITKSAPAAVYAYDGGALESFRAARRAGARTIYELPIAYWGFLNKLLMEEAELQPDFADTFTGLCFDPAWIARRDEELELADAVIVPSEYVKSTLPQSLQKDVHVIPYGAPGVLDGEAQQRTRHPKLRVLYVGGLTQRKGISYLFDAVGNTEQAVELTIIGSRLGSCKALDGMLERYRWIPSAKHSAVLDEMMQHDVLALPTLSEGFALVILEAMSRGMVVITTPNSGAKDLLTDGENGFIIPIRSSEALAEKLLVLQRDRDLLESMSQSALRRARGCNWENYRAALAGAVEKVIADGRA